MSNHFRYKHLSPKQQAEARAMFSASSDFDNYLYEIGTGGSVLCRHYDYDRDERDMARMDFADEARIEDEE